MNEDEYLESLYADGFELDYSEQDGIYICPECEYSITECECERVEYGYA